MCFQICGKVFTKTYNLTVHMRMHQDIRPFPCTVCEQTFRQKAHLQRHEATHGIDSMANRKRRKRPLDENGLDTSGGDPGKIGIMEGEEEEEEADDDIAYRPFVEKRKFAPAVMKTERDEEGGGTDLDPMIEPIVRQQVGSGSSTQQDTEKRLLCVPVNVGTNTEAMARQHHVLNDEIEESTLEPVRFREAAPLPPRLIQVEQGVQYCAEDLLQDEEEELDSYGRHPDQDVKYSGGGGGDDSRINGISTGADDEGGASLRERQGLKCENEEEEGEGGVCHMDQSAAAMAGDDEGVVTYSSQEETHYHVTTVEGEDGQQQLIAQTADGSYIDASGSQLVMSADGELVGFVPLDSGGAQQHSSQVVNISTSTNEHGQQVVIIENLHAHSPELQQEILRALMSDTNLIPLSQA
jgi:hypothetical protein